MKGSRNRYSDAEIIDRYSQRIVTDIARMISLVTLPIQVFSISVTSRAIPHKPHSSQIVLPGLALRHLADTRW